MAADSDLDLNIDQTVDSFINEVAPGAEVPPGVPSDPAAPAPAVTSLAKPAPEGGAPAEVPYPKSWKQDYSTFWPKIPREVQEYVTNVREKDYLDGLEQYKTGHQAYSAINEVMGPYMPRLTALGMQPAEAIRTLMNADWVLSQGSMEQRVAMLAQICQSYGIDPAQIKPAGEQPYRTAAELELVKKFDGLHSNVNQFIQAQVAEKKKAIGADVAKFFADPAHPYANEVADDIILLINAGIDLPGAYEKAVWANPTTRAKEIERLNKANEDKARKEREAAAEAARKAKLANVRGTPTARTTGAGKVGWEEALPVTAAAIAKRT